ncbi:MAG: DNA cytosine methyltransferase [Thermodesulfovibrionales bacterium]|jgi:DNA (cytosine-5)-methyltransferase 1
MKKLNVIDLFAGCGGFSEGFEQSGLYRMIAHVEWDLAPCRVLINQLKTKWGYADAEKRVLRFDMQRTDELIRGWINDPQYGSGIGLKKIVREEKTLDIIIGGPPCQAYSVAGRIRDEHGMHFDYRNFLFEKYLAIVNFFKPTAIIFENVTGILSAAPGGLNITERISRAFHDIGYEIINDIRAKAVIKCVNFGIPQERSRVIILGIRRSIFKKNRQAILSNFYDEMLPRFHQTIKTVSDAISDLPECFPAKKYYKMNGKNYSHTPPFSEIPNHSPRFHNYRDIRIFRQLASDVISGNGKYSSVDSLKKLYKERTGKSSNVHKYYVLRWNKPSNTIPAHLYKDGLRHIHPDPAQARSITVREAARLQSFDDDFVFLGSIGDQYKMIGNAVPPVAARCIAHALHDFLMRYA